MAIYAALRIPEVWEIRGGKLTVHLLAAGSYEVSEQSAAFPCLPIAELESWLGRATGMGETAWIRAFRGWVRDTLA